MNHFVYILKCADGTLYVGSTNDLAKRIIQHNTAKAGAHYTKIRRPVELVYSETVKTFLEARRREAEIKNWRRKKKLELIQPANVESGATTRQKPRWTAFCAPIAKLLDKTGAVVV